MSINRLCEPVLASICILNLTGSLGVGNEVWKNQRWMLKHVGSGLLVAKRPGQGYPNLRSILCRARRAGGWRIGAMEIKTRTVKEVPALVALTLVPSFTSTYPSFLIRFRS
jgi:hypothetical protein